MALLVLTCAGAGWLGWKALRDPGIPFLPAGRGAAWIVYPSAPSTLPQPGVEMDAVFRSSFVLDRRPREAVLRAWFFRQGGIRINGAPVATAAPGGDWKRPVEVSGDALARLLRPGVNRIEALVANGSGPPALRLSLAAGELRLETGRGWEASLAGASWRRARLAATPMSRWSRPGLLARALNPPPLEAARATLPLLVLFALAGAGLLAAGRFVWRRREARGGGAEVGRWEAAALLAGVAVIWGALFWHDRHLSPMWGFDSEGHLTYVQEILERGRLPLADEGWEMYQPPLYYLLAAGLLRLAGHATVDASGVELLRGLGWAAGLLQCAAVLGGLRILFAGRRAPVLAGLALAAFLPVQLYMFLYVSNEGLHAALSSLALLLALRILARDDTRARSHLLLGAVLGLALLAKFSALLTLAAVLAALAGRLLARRVREPRVYVRTVGAAALACLLVCGWHYARVALRFGHPIVGNWDPATGFRWWQQPGYSTAGYFLRFGRALAAPLFSAFHSLPDALYSTFWGDGLLGGSATLAARPPWSHGLMAAGYLLALLPALALLAGLVAMLREAGRRPRATGLLMLGVAGLTGFAIVAMTLRLPFYAQAKAFYGLAAMTAVAAFAGRGFEALAGKARARQAVASILLAAWAVNAYATFWIPGGRAGEPGAEAMAALDPGGLLARSAAALEAGRLAEAANLARAAAERDPDHPFAWSQLGAALAAAGRNGPAIAALREALRVTPADARIHAQLSRLYGASGDRGRKSYHAACAARLEAGFHASRER